MLCQTLWNKGFFFYSWHGKEYQSLQLKATEVRRACSSHKGLAWAFLNKLPKHDHLCFLVSMTSGMPNKRQELQHLLNCFIVCVTEDFEKNFENQYFQEAYIFLYPIWFFFHLRLTLCDNLGKFNIIQNFNISSKLRIQ